MNKQINITDRIFIKCKSKEMTDLLCKYLESIGYTNYYNRKHNGGCDEAATGLNIWLNTTNQMMEQGEYGVSSLRPEDFYFQFHAETQMGEIMEKLFKEVPLKIDNVNGQEYDISFSDISDDCINMGSYCFLNTHIEKQYDFLKCSPSDSSDYICTFGFKFTKEILEQIINHPQFKKSKS